MFAFFLRGSTWHATYQFNGKQCRQSLKTSNKKNAIRKALELDRKLSAGELPVQPKSATISEVAEAYIDSLRVDHNCPANGFAIGWNI